MWDFTEGESERGNEGEVEGSLENRTDLHKLIKPSSTGPAQPLTSSFRSVLAMNICLLSMCLASSVSLCFLLLWSGRIWDSGDWAINTERRREESDARERQNKAGNFKCCKNYSTCGLAQAHQLLTYHVTFLRELTCGKAFPSSSTLLPLFTSLF